MEFLRQKTGLITDNSLGDEDAKLHSQNPFLYNTDTSVMKTLGFVSLKSL